MKKMKFKRGVVAGALAMAFAFASPFWAGCGEKKPDDTNKTQTGQEQVTFKSQCVTALSKVNESMAYSNLKDGTPSTEGNYTMFGVLPNQQIPNSMFQGYNVNYDFFISNYIVTLLNIINDSTLNWNLSSTITKKIVLSDDFILPIGSGTVYLTLKSPQKIGDVLKFEMLATNVVTRTTHGVDEESNEVEETETAIRETYIVLSVKNTSNDLKWELLIAGDSGEYESIDEVDFTSFFQSTEHEPNINLCAYDSQNKIKSISFGYEESTGGSTPKQEIKTVLSNKIKTDYVGENQSGIAYSISKEAMNSASDISRLFGFSINSLSVKLQKATVINFLLREVDPDLHYEYYYRDEITGLQTFSNMIFNEDIEIELNKTYKITGSLHKFLFRFEGTGFNLKLKLYEEFDTYVLKAGVENNPGINAVTDFDYVTKYRYTELVSFNVENFKVKNFSLKNVNWIENTNWTTAETWAEVEKDSSSTWRDSFLTDKTIAENGTIYNYNSSNETRLTTQGNQDVNTWGINTFRKSSVDEVIDLTPTQEPEEDPVVIEEP